MIDRVEARLRVARMLAPPGEQRDRVREAVALARIGPRRDRATARSATLIVARVAASRT